MIASSQILSFNEFKMVSKDGHFQKLVFVFLKYVL